MQANVNIIANEVYCDRFIRYLGFGWWPPCGFAPFDRLCRSSGACERNINGAMLRGTAGCDCKRAKNQRPESR